MNDTTISRAELFALPEYSCSLPTGTVIGKRWRRDVHAYRRDKHGQPIIYPDEQHEWWIGEYVEHHDSEKIGIKWTWAVDASHEPHRGELL